MYSLLAFYSTDRLEAPNKQFRSKLQKLKEGRFVTQLPQTGTLEAIKTVSVGTQVSGVIEKIYVDFNSQVKKGQLLAQLDETPLLAQLDQSKASVDQAEAQVKYQKATFDRYEILVEKKTDCSIGF